MDGHESEHDNTHDDEQDDAETSPLGVFQISPRASGRVVGMGQIVGVGAAPESEEVAELSGRVSGVADLRGSLEVVVPLPPVVSSSHDLKRTTFLVDFYHSGDPQEQYQVRYLESNRQGEYEEWEELDHDVVALLLEVGRRMVERMERNLD